MSDERPWHTFDSEGRCIAWRNSLPIGTEVAEDPEVLGLAVSDPAILFRRYWVEAADWNQLDRLVIVVAWPDGSPPEAPEPDALAARLVAMLRLIDWRGQEAPLRNLLAECAGALEAASIIRQEVKP